MRTKRIIKILIICVLLSVFGCGVLNALMQHDDYNNSKAKSEIGEKADVTKPADDIWHGKEAVPEYKCETEVYQKDFVEKEKDSLDHKMESDMGSELDIFLVYYALLAEYERVMKDMSYTEEQWDSDVYDQVKRYIGKKQLYYCIKDLTGDGKPELILGVKRERELEILDTIYEAGYDPFIIYAYDGSGIRRAGISEEYIMTIYKNGVIGLISGGVDMHFMYKQIEENEVSAKSLDIIVERQIAREEPYYYKYKMENGEYVYGEYEELSEEEFYKIRNQYTAEKEELNWRPVDGFYFS